MLLHNNKVRKRQPLTSIVLTVSVAIGRKGLKDSLLLLKANTAAIVLNAHPKIIVKNRDFNINNNKISEGNDFIYTGIGIYKPELFLNYTDIELGSILHKENNIGAELYKGLWDDVGTPDRLNMIRERIAL